MATVPQPAMAIEIDSEKLVLAVKQRPALYDYSMKAHHNKDLVERLWNEIAEEFDSTVADCKMKWANLRNSFSRYIRLSSSKNKNRKVWYLAQSMEFMRDHTGPNKKAWRPDFFNEVDTGLEESMSSIRSAQQEEPMEFAEEEDATLQSIAQYLKARSSIMQQQAQQQESFSPHLQFFKSLLPDMELLSPRNQRIFKAEVLAMLNKLLDEEESA